MISNAKTRLIELPSAIANANLRQSWQYLGSPRRKEIQREWRRITRRYPHEVPSEWLHGTDGFPGWIIFYRDLGQHRPSKNHTVRRHDQSKPFGIGNAFWSATGRPLSMVMVAGQELPLRDAALLADCCENSYIARAKKLTPESSMLTPAKCRMPYPVNDAIAFLSKLDLNSIEAFDLVEAERKRWGNKNPLNKTVLRKTRKEKWHALAHSKAADHIGKVMNLPISPSDRVRLLAFYSMSKEVQRKTYGILGNIIARCCNTKHKHYDRYGGRGIRVCRTWIRGAGGLTGLQCFVADMGAWQPGMEVDRIDPDGNYEMSNCRWVTRTQNINNTFTWEDVANRLLDMELAETGQLRRSTLLAAGHERLDPTSRIYRNMVDRCTNPGSDSWHYYGGRGIKVCDRWLNGDGKQSGFQCFVQDVGMQPNGMQLDRIDNDGNYGPANCRWLTPEENKRNSWRLSHLVDRLDAMVAAKARAMQIEQERLAAKATASD